MKEIILGFLLLIAPSTNASEQSVTAKCSEHCEQQQTIKAPTKEEIEAANKRIKELEKQLGDYDEKIRDNQEFLKSRTLPFPSLP